MNDAKGVARLRVLHKFSYIQIEMGGCSSCFMGKQNFYNLSYNILWLKKSYILIKGIGQLFCEKKRYVKL